MTRRTIEFLARRKRDLQYARYLALHKWFVARACLQAGQFLHALTHDASKLLPSEWRAYREYFYTPGEHTPDTEIAQAFDRAWLAHQKRNRHHWQAWILIEDSGRARPLPMPRDAVLEMLCDWYGEGKAIHRHPLGWQATRVWYCANASKIKLHPETARMVVLTLAYFESREWAGYTGASRRMPPRPVQPVQPPQPEPVPEQGPRPGPRLVPDPAPPWTDEPAAASEDRGNGSGPGEESVAGEESDHTGGLT